MITLPAVSTILTSKSGYGLSSTQYGVMFLPQVVTAIATSLLGAALARRITTKRVFLTGLALSTVSTGLLLGSALLKTDPEPRRAWARAAPRGYPRGSGSTPRSRCYMASARR